MPRQGGPDFGAVVLRHEAPPEDRVGLLWIAVFVFGSFFMLAVSLIFDRRPGPPPPVYYLLWLGFVLAASRGIVGRYVATPMVLLERGLFLPAYRPLHWLALRRRAVSFDDLKGVRLDSTGFRSGSHLFETAQGPKRCAKAYFPPARKFADELKRLAPSVEVEFVDRRGKRKRYAPVINKRPRKPVAKGDESHAK